MGQEFRRVYPDVDALAKAAAAELFRLAHESVQQRGVFTVALSGGSTPKRLYAILGTEPAYETFPWNETHFFFGDERHVPPSHIDSNYLMTSGSLLAGGRVPAGHVHRIRAELPDANMAAADYDVELHSFFPQGLRLNDFPRFDAILLGMGPDGHTASLFPGSKALAEKERWVVANWVEKFKSNRITFTFPVINAARHVLMLVAGADKTDMLHDVLVSPPGIIPYPVQLVQPVDGVKLWMLDEKAAERLPAAP